VASHIDGVATKAHNAAMKPPYLRIAASTLMTGLAISAIGWTTSNHNSRELVSVENKPTSVAENSFQSKPASSPESSCVNFPEDNKFRPQLNGTKLPLPVDGIEAETISEAKVTPMPSGGLIVMLNNTLYRLDGGKRLVWKYTTSQIMFEFAYIPTTGLIYGTAGDGVMFILNAADGTKLLGDSYNGRAAYGMVRAYGKDECLITSNYSGYRDWERFDPKSLKDVPTWRDEVTAYRGTKALWSRDFPPDADLVVDGKRILAVTKTKSSFYVMEISVPTSTIR
jgi:hypothetical protein